MQKQDVVRYVRTYIGKTKARAVATLEGGDVTVDFNLEPWSRSNSAARRGFNDRSRKLFDRLFSDFSNAERIEITAYGEFVDVRGHAKRYKTAYAALSRRTAAGINFRYVKKENLPSIVDSCWMHPALLK